MMGLEQLVHGLKSDFYSPRCGSVVDLVYRFGALIGCTRYGNQG